MAKHINKMLFIILFGIIIFQTTAIPQLAICKIVPNLAVAFLIALVITNKVKNVFGVALLTGLILDIFSGMPFGIITASLILAIFTINILVFKFLKNREFFVLAPIIFLGLLTYNLALIILLNLSALPLAAESIKQLFPIFASKTLIELALVLVFYKFMERI